MKSSTSLCGVINGLTHSRNSLSLSWADWSCRNTAHAYIRDITNELRKFPCNPPPPTPPFPFFTNTGKQLQACPKQNLLERPGTKATRGGVLCTCHMRLRPQVAGSSPCALDCDMPGGPHELLREKLHPPPPRAGNYNSTALRARRSPRMNQCHWQHAHLCAVTASTWRSTSSSTRLPFYSFHARWRLLQLLQLDWCP